VPENELTKQELTDALSSMVPFFQELMAENIAMHSTLKGLTGKVSWLSDYKSYLQMAQESSAAAFASLSRALSDKSSLRSAVEQFVRLYTTTHQTVASKVQDQGTL
jgi:hypothetical protein